MAKTYWMVRDCNGLYLCTDKPYRSEAGVYYYSPDSVLLHENDFPWVERGVCIEVALILKPVECISTAQTKAAKRHRLEGRTGNE